MSDLRYGRKPPKNAPAIKFGDILKAGVPAHPSSVDYLSKITSWNMLGNNKYGDCVSVAIANTRKVITAALGDAPYEPTLDHVLSFYKTENPNFPNQDDGMDEQTALEEMVKNGDKYFDGVKLLAFAKVNVSNPQELDAAVDIFGPNLLGIMVTYANEDQFAAGQPWDYDAMSSTAGGHATVEGGYDESKKTGKMETWAKVVNYTDKFRQYQLEEFWIMIWPEHLGTKAFQEGVDQAALAAAYTSLTGRPFPVTPAPSPAPTPTPVPPQPTPTPVDVDHEMADAQIAWEAHEDNMKSMRACDKTLEAANRKWRLQKGLL
jgi:hypothetical protein